MVYVLGMNRFSLAVAALVAAPLAFSSVAWADRPIISTVRVPESSLVGQESGIAKILYLNRCTGGCQVKTGSINNSITNETTIGRPGDNTLSAFNGDDTEWKAILKCVQEMYSPYDIQVTDVDPSPRFHGEAMVGGLPTEIGHRADSGGVSPSGGCNPINNVINFTFANVYTRGPGRAVELCGVIGQESAHSYGLDHEFDCSTPMTYLRLCGQPFFRNKNLKCGEFEGVRPCNCGATQNSHTSLLATFGPGTVTTGNPISSIVTPSGGTVANGFTVVAMASDRRGLSRAEVLLNGYKWAEYTEKRTPDKQNGTISIQMPTNVPDGIIDIEVKAFNDLEMSTTSQKVTVTKGAACTSAATCAPGQQCAAGKCFWEPATGVVGDACEYPQFCESGKCEDLGAGPVCTKICFSGVEGTCPEKFECVNAGASNYCVAAASSDGGGCCSVGGGNETALLVNGGIGAMLAMLLLGRRRRK
jgi:hypothetical protein